jgi:predicted RNA-binding Zn-ribbon protein involved in translation (DUF1610 family)
MAEYEEIYIEDLMDALPDGFEKTDIDNCGEYIVRCPLSPEDNELFLTVFTSIDIADGVSRPPGKDAIRVTILDKEGNFICGTRRINRVDGWKDRLWQRIEELMEFTPKKCPLCGAYMILRKGRHGKFMGCKSYPRCKHTENV